MFDWDGHAHRLPSKSFGIQHNYKLQIIYTQKED